MVPQPLAAAAQALQEGMIDVILSRGDGFDGGGDGNRGGHGGGHGDGHHGGGDDGSGLVRQSLFNSTGNGGGGSRGLRSRSIQNRTGVVVSLAFSLVAALIIIYTIVHDAYKVKPGEIYSRAQKQSSIFKALHPAEVFPFILAVAILIQGFVFIGEQSTGFEHLKGFGCQGTSQVIFTATFVVFLVVVAFSLETSVRALQRKRFQPRRRFTTPLCLGGVSLASIGLFLYAHFTKPESDICPLSLSWWTSAWPATGIVLVAVIVLLHITAGAIITTRLLSTRDILLEERIAASRIVYTMAIDLVIIILLLPFWVSLVIDTTTVPVQESFVAEVGITLTGMLFAVLHIFTRANAERMAIGFKNTSGAKDRRIRLFGSSDLHNRNISGPVLEPKLSVRQQPAAPAAVPARPLRPDWQPPQAQAPQMGATLMQRPYQIPNEPPPEYPDPMNLRETVPRDFTATAAAPAPAPTRPLPPPAAAALPEKQPILFEVHPGTPVDAAAAAAAATPTAPEPTYERRPTMASIASDFSSTSSNVTRPPPLFATRAGGHERMDSTFTSAEIEIGLRLSNAPPDMDDDLGEGPDTDKSLPTTPRTPNAHQTTSPEVALPMTARPPLPMKIGLGALGSGPKSGLQIAATQPVRTSPLATTVTKASTTTTPSPVEKPNPFSPTDSKGGPKHSLAPPPPPTYGLPSNPSPRSRQPSPAPPPRRTPSPVQQPLSASPPPVQLPSSPPAQLTPPPVQRSPVQQSPVQWSPVQQSPVQHSLAPTRGSFTSTQRSPTEWPQWPAGDEVDLATPVEKRWK